MIKARIILFVIAGGFIGVGIWLGEPAATMMNAITLCLSCMGVG